ncbi:hypothetical protein PIIN_07870 [Serendipita indica DSM 11827]|uniref:Uncharacterized protein n=1 Tax=Serendipita indica (strain DSM 11827) TaxID=1109443 RepID=G4TRH0_SERID|nr:hypothetical protein PIIN_07870 [Serendipita indica DSM 11827]
MTLIAPSTAASTRALTSGSSRAFEQLSNHLQFSSISDSTTLYPQGDVTGPDEHTSECQCSHLPTSKVKTPQGVIEVQFCTCYVQETEAYEQSPRHPAYLQVPKQKQNGRARY